ncbi:hypothetical protein C8F04DRAFT_1197199 [Mycena alexandri]|uniref:Uncharacterized protein n=1 Tax=Mycena alexandri TaxID=1745969 RepID=A0AAD6S6D6_9AGAR|nr:hypothetical protein C8F04DRAFT_1197199 [Mycena alexandri]
MDLDAAAAILGCVMSFLGVIHSGASPSRFKKILRPQKANPSESITQIFELHFGSGGDHRPTWTQSVLVTPDSDSQRNKTLGTSIVEFSDPEPCRQLRGAVPQPPPACHVPLAVIHMALNTSHPVQSASSKQMMKHCRREAAIFRFDRPQMEIQTTGSTREVTRAPSSASTNILTTLGERQRFVVSTDPKIAIGRRKTPSFTRPEDTATQTGSERNFIPPRGTSDLPTQIESGIFVGGSRMGEEFSAEFNTTDIAVGERAVRENLTPTQGITSSHAK